MTIPLVFELVLEIAKYVSSTDHASMMLVNKLWFACVVSLRWQTMSVSRKHARSFKLIRTSVHRHLYGAAIRTLVVDAFMRSQLSWIVELCPHLNSVTSRVGPEGLSPLLGLAELQVWDFPRRCNDSLKKQHERRGTCLRVERRLLGSDMIVLNAIASQNPVSTLILGPQCPAVPFFREGSRFLNFSCLHTLVVNVGFEFKDEVGTLDSLLTDEGALHLIRTAPFLAVYQVIADLPKLDRRTDITLRALATSWPSVERIWISQQSLYPGWSCWADEVLTRTSLAHHVWCLR